MRFRDVQHQQRALSILRRALASGRTHHAYLFDGPDGVGKELAARALAARLLCEDDSLVPEDDACGECRSCRLFTAGNHADYHPIHRGLHQQHPDRAVRSRKGLFLAVDVIRHFLIEPAGTSPSLGRRRVFVVRDAHRMNEGAQNALLKTLEEPPGSVCLILVTSSAQRLLPTIRSRCQRIPFDLLPTLFVRQRLATQTDAAAAVVSVLANLAQGRLGAALQWHRIDLLAALRAVDTELTAGNIRNPELFAKSLLEIARELALRIAEDTEPGESGAEGGGRSRASAKNIDTDQLRDSLRLVLSLVAAIYRDALLRCELNSALCWLDAGYSAPKQLAETADSEQLADAARNVAEAERMLDRNVTPQLACEHMAIALSGEALPQ